MGHGDNNGIDKMIIFFCHTATWSGLRTVSTFTNRGLQGRGPLNAASTSAAPGYRGLQLINLANVF